MSENNDKDIPRSSEYSTGPVLEGNFNNTPNVHIFWGPGQFTINWPAYNGPDKEKWRHYEPLQIPQVVRFIYDALDDYDSDKWLPRTHPPAEIIWWYIYKAGWEPTSTGGSMFWVHMRKYRNSIAQSEHSDYTMNPTEHTYFDVGQHFEVGTMFQPMSYPVVDYAVDAGKYFVRGDFANTVYLY